MRIEFMKRVARAIGVAGAALTLSAVATAGTYDITMVSRHAVDVGSVPMPV